MLLSRLKIGTRDADVGRNFTYKKQIELGFDRSNKMSLFLTEYPEDLHTNILMTLLSQKLYVIQWHPSHLPSHILTDNIVLFIWYLHYNTSYIFQHPAFRFSSAGRCTVLLFSDYLQINFVSWGEWGGCRFNKSWSSEKLQGVIRTEQLSIRALSTICSVGNNGTCWTNDRWHQPFPLSLTWKQVLGS